MRRRQLLRAGTGLSALSVLSGLAACGSGEPAPAGQVRIATGGTTAVYYLYGRAIVELIHQRLRHVQPAVLVTAASAENITLVLGGGAEVGFSQADVAAEKVGRSASDLLSLARLYDDNVHLVVREDGPIGTLADLRQRRVSVGARGSGTSFTAQRVLSVGPAGLTDGLKRFDLGLDDSAAGLREGRIDAFFFSGGPPVAAIANLATTVALRLIDLHDLVEPLRRRYGEYYTDRVVPGSTYPGVKTAQTIGIPNYLVVRSSMADSMAYALTKLLFDGRDTIARAHPVGNRLEVRSAISTPPLSLHPGAARYYRAIKV
jgi:TRAP transporter TAXI family solute receptor